MESTDKDYAIHMELSRISTQSVFRIKKKWKKHLNSRCRDLLEVDDLYDREDASFHTGKINLLHRTVGDFLRNNYSDELRRRAGEGFDARSSLCKTIIALSKVSADRNRPNLFGRSDTNIPNLDLVREMLYYAKDYERTEDQSIAVLLDELDRVNTIRTKGSHIHWANKGRSLETELNGCTFLALTIQAGLRIYVKEKLELNKMLITQKCGRPLLDYACKPNLRERSDLADPQMVRLLLEHGSDANEPVNGIVGPHTVWELFVFECYRKEYWDEDTNESLKTMQEIMEFMIDHGADPNAKIQGVDQPKRGLSRRARIAAPGTRQGLTQGAIAEVEDESTMLSVQMMLEAIFGADRAARLALRMEEYAQRNTPTTPPPPPPPAPAPAPPSLFRRLLGWK